MRAGTAAADVGAVAPQPVVQGYAARAVGPARPVRIGVAEVAGVAGFLGVVRLAAAADAAEARGDGVRAHAGGADVVGARDAVVAGARVVGVSRAVLVLHAVAVRVVAGDEAGITRLPGVISPSQVPQTFAVQVCSPCWQLPSSLPQSRVVPGLQLQPSFRLKLQSVSSPATSQSSLGLEPRLPCTCPSCRPPDRSARRPRTSPRVPRACCRAAGRRLRSPSSFAVCRHPRTRPTSTWSGPQMRWPQSPQSSSWSASQSPTGGCAVPRSRPSKSTSLPPAPTDCCAPRCLPSTRRLPAGDRKRLHPCLQRPRSPRTTFRPLTSCLRSKFFRPEPELPAEPETPLFPAPASPSKSYFLLSTEHPVQESQKREPPRSRTPRSHVRIPVSSCWSSRSGLARSSCRWW